MSATVNGTAPPAKAAAAERDAASAIMTAWLRILTEPGQIVELRALKYAVDRDRFACTMAGYYDANHLDRMARAAYDLTGKSTGIYWTLNPLNPPLLARRANRVGKADSGDLSSDKDVLRRRLLLIDADPCRVSGVSSTDAEKQLAFEVIQQVRDYLTAQGLPAPILADSGNGYHLIYRIDLPADDGGLVKRCLQALDARFSTAAVKIDTVVHNPARICKLYGTMARKGDSTPDRPHRRATILEIPGCADVLAPVGADFRPVPLAMLEALAAECPHEAKSQTNGHATNGHANGTYQTDSGDSHRSRLKVAVWLDARGVAYTATEESDRTKYIIVCPFDGDHRGKDAAIFQYPNGALSFKCFHDSCSGHHWAEAKKKIGKPAPDHYDPPLSGKKRPSKSAKRGQFGTPQAPSSEAYADLDTAAAGPDATADADGLPIVLLGIDEHRVLDETIALIAANDPDVYQRGGRLVSIRTDIKPAGSGKVRRSAASPRIVPIPLPSLRVLLTKVVHYVGLGNNGKPEDAHPPDYIVKALDAAGNWQGIRPLEAITETPILRGDGTVLQTPGYDADTGVIYAPSGAFPEVPEFPTHEQVEAAREALLEVVVDFPFGRQQINPHGSPAY